MFGYRWAVCVCTQYKFCAQCSLCHPDVVTLCRTGFSCAAVLGHRLPWGETSERGRKIYCVFSQHIIDTSFFFFSSLPSRLPPILLSCFIRSLQVTACLQGLKVQEEERSEAPVLQRTSSDGDTWVGRRRGVAGAMHQGWGGIAAGDTHSVERGRGRAARCGDEAQTAHGGAVCRAPPAWPGQDLPSGWRRGLGSQPEGPQSVSQGQGARRLLSSSVLPFSGRTRLLMPCFHQSVFCIILF